MKGPFLRAVVSAAMILRNVSPLVLRQTVRQDRFVSASVRLLASSSPTSSASSSSSSSSSLSLSSAGGVGEQQILSHRLDGLDKPTVWHEFSPLAVKHKAVNLGQGFPDWNPPFFVQEAMKKAVDPSFGRHANQYARSYAHMPLAKVLAADYSQRWNVEIDPVTQIATAVGCTNALYCALQGLVNPGDEVIMLEPFFDIYASQVKMAGGIPVYVPLRPTTDASSSNSDNTILAANDVFTLDMAELENAITEKTKVLLLNSPHNPTGKMFSRAELESIAAIVQKHPTMTIISDEVYEFIVFSKETQPHISMASISPEIFQQTLTLSSAGKTFSATGWKVGWAVGPVHLVKAVISVQQWVNFSVATPNQDAIAQAMEQAVQPFEGFDNYYDYLASEYKRKRDLLSSALASVGMIPAVPAGGFFIMADTSRIDGPPLSYLQETTEASPNPMTRDWALSRWLTQTVGVTAIPPSAFYSPDNMHLAASYLRFAFCKGDDTLLKAQGRLQDYFGKV